MGLVGKRVLTVTDHEDVLVVTMESVADVTGRPRCGVIASGHARDRVTLIDAPSFGRAVRLVWHKRALRTCGGGEARRVMVGG